MPSEESLIHLTEEFQDLGFEYIDNGQRQPSDAISKELLTNLLQMPRLYGTIIEDISAPYEDYYFLSVDKMENKIAIENQDDNEDDDYTTESTSQIGPVAVTTKFIPTFFKPGKQFSGYQTCTDRKYPARMDVLNVDVTISTGQLTTLTPHFAGTLSIENLGSGLTEVKTYFEGYIINYNQFGLFSSEWGQESYLKDYLCEDHIDLIHWGLFPQFSYLFRDCFVEEQQDSNENPFLNISKIRDNIINKCKRIKDISQQRYIFMKLKEKFFVPEEVEIKNISHDGLYYLCHDQQEGNIFGFYQSNRGEVYQRLDINPINKPDDEEDNSTFEFN